jgi:hypothetical protein
MFSCPPPFPVGLYAAPIFLYRGYYDSTVHFLRRIVTSTAAHPGTFYRGFSTTIKRLTALS